MTITAGCVQSMGCYMHHLALMPLPVFFFFFCLLFPLPSMFFPPFYPINDSSSRFLFSAHMSRFQKGLPCSRSHITLLYLLHYPYH